MKIYIFRQIDINYGGIEWAIAVAHSEAEARQIIALQLPNYQWDAKHASYSEESIRKPSAIFWTYLDKR